MCLLICSPSGRINDPQTLSRGFENNMYGAGYAYSYNNGLFVKKGFFDFDDFFKSYSKIPKNAPNIVHFRLATSGKYNEENCHPFNVNENLAFAHNGVFSCVKGDDFHSDTYKFNELICKPLFSKNESLILEDATKFVLYKTIGSYNKIAFIKNSGEIIIVNEEAGYWENGIWFSNSSGKYPRSFSYIKG